MHTTLSNKRLIIAIDGHSSCGKSTFAKSIAKRLGYIFIDTGAMYRAVTLFTMRSGAESTNAIVEQLANIDITFKYSDSRGASDIYLNGERVEDEIRKMEVSSRVSSVAAIAEVREKLVALQQQMGRSGGVVMDGRDIGTVVFPDAQIKIFMSADARVRAQRRYDELKAKGEVVNFDEILENVVMRDRDDESRAVSPLKRAEDAILLDNSYMSVEEQMAWFDKLYSERVEK